MSIPLVVWGSKFVMLLLERFSWTVLLGGGLLGYLAGEMIDTDRAVGPFLHLTLHFPDHYLPYICIVLVMVIGKWLGWRAQNKGALRP
jgi:predicted tellurium resistance membrane protein TerC